MKKNISHKEVLTFISVVRASFHDASVIYKWGGCYGFYKILKHLYPSAVAYFDDCEHDHILTKIGDHFYHIDGVFSPEHRNADVSEIKKLTKKDHEHWETVAAGQRVEFIIAKHNRKCLLHAKGD